MIRKPIENKRIFYIMTLTLNKILKKLFFTLLTLIFITFLYFIIAVILSYFPTSASKKDTTIEFYILYNDMHSDIVVKIEDTSSIFQEKFKKTIKRKHGYLAIGWGDKETYLNTPTWNDLSITTTVKALFTNTLSLIHVNYIQNIHNYQKIKKIKISKIQFQHIEQSILRSLTSTIRTYKGYTSNDLFYDSLYSYNVFHTCNTWTGDRLREANISMSYWTPLSQNVIVSLP